MTDPSIFVSYSHADKELARALADALRARRLGVWIDDDELKIGDSIIERIATAIAGIDFFLVLVSEASSDSNWCRKELSLAVTGELGREGVTVLPVRVRGAQMPDALADKLYADLNEGNVDEVADRIAAAVPKHQAEQREVIADRKRAARAPAKAPEAEYEPIKIIGIVEEGVGRPRNDGSAGSALYRVPLRLSRKPSSDWAGHFRDVWNRPPRFTTMHRPGIASVVGDTIVLDGTTMDELETYHVDTLKLVLDKVNADVAEHERVERERREREDAERRAHEQSVSDAAKRIRFDDDRPAVRPDRLRRFSPEDAFREFKEQYDVEAGIWSIETGSYEGMAAIVAMVEPGFERTRLPAGFRGYPVLINDGTRAYEAGGPLE